MDDLLGDLSSGKNAPKGNTSGSAGGSSPAKGSKQGQGGASQAEINSYISQVQAAIKGHLYDWDTYKGKTCTLRVNLAQDGTLLSVEIGRRRSGVLSANAGGNEPDDEVP
ncbi:cell envelope integrity inner membrane protein TolA [Klebsiella michiganensis]|nr:cell envelope integrity inner membrane protein TolA [Klebsiella michiganensis]